MKVAALFLFLFSGFAPAEYRVFSLKIESPDGQDVSQIESNLDPQQYVKYYPVKNSYKVSYTETWMCKGRTNGQPICPNPKATAKDEALRAPATADPSPATP